MPLKSQKSKATAKKSAITSSSSLLARIIDTPHLGQVVRALPAQSFSSLVRLVGLEDASELIALASTPQLIAAFDEDLFVNKAPGEEEAFDPERFATWLEVLLEGGDAAAAQRLSELSEDFLVLAFSRLAWVFDADALRDHMAQSDDDRAALRVEKALESALVEEIEGYLLVAKVYDGWDATFAVITALDRDQRPLLVRVLDRCVALNVEYSEDIAALSRLLTSAGSVAEDVAAERDARRSSQGFIEPRAAKGFLALAKLPLEGLLSMQTRDAATRMYFRDLDRDALPPPLSEAAEPWVAALPSLAHPDAAPPPQHQEPLAIIEALKALEQTDNPRFQARMEELSFLANVLISAASLGGQRLRAGEAGEIALLTVAYGAALEAHLEAYQDKENKPQRVQPPATQQLLALLTQTSADLLFRRASHALHDQKLTPEDACFIRSREHLEATLAITSPLDAAPKTPC